MPEVFGEKLASTIASIWRLSIPYFRSDDRWAGRHLLGAVIVIELSLVAIQVILNEWYNRFYITLQDHNWDAFVSAILFFCVLAAVYTVLAVYQLYLTQWLQIRWRRWMTQTYLHQWLNAANHYRMQLLGDTADNPDQRIAEDLQLFVQYALTTWHRSAQLHRDAVSRSSSFCGPCRACAAACCPAPISLCPAIWSGRR